VLTDDPRSPPRGETPVPATFPSGPAGGLSVLDDGAIGGSVDVFVQPGMRIRGRCTGKCALGWSLGAFYPCQLMDRGEHAPDRAVLLFGAAPVCVPTRTKSVQLHIAPGDEYCTDQEISAAVAGFAQPGIAVQRFNDPGLGHWFAEVGSPAYDQEGTRLATERVLTFLGLQAGS